MNKWCGTGRAVRDPDVRYTQDQLCVGRFTIAVDRRGKKEEGKPTADFISCVGFGKTGEFIEKFVKKGMKFDVTGRIQTGSYTDKDNRRVNTVEIVLDEIEFGESKKSQETQEQKSDEGFMDVPDDVDDQLPFN